MMIRILTLAAAFLMIFVLVACARAGDAIQVAGAATVTTGPSPEPTASLSPSSTKQTFKLEDLFKGQPLAVFGQDLIRLASTSPDGKLLVLVFSDGRVEWLDSASGQVLGSLMVEGERQPVAEIVFSPDSRLFALSAADQADVIGLDSNGVVASLEAQLQPGIAELVFASPQTIVYREVQTYSYGGFHKLVSFPIGTQNAVTLPVPDRPEIFGFTAPALSQDGRLVAAGMTTGRVLVWDPATTVLKVVLGGHNAPVSAVAFQPDGDLLASIDTAGVIRLRKVNSGELVRSLTSKVGEQPVLAFEDSQHLLVKSTGKPVERIDLESGEVGTTTPAYAAPHPLLLERYATGVARAGSGGLRPLFSPDGRRLAVISAIVQVWDLESGQLAQVISAGEGEVAQAAAFSPDSSKLAVGYGNRAVRIWDAHNGSLLYELRGPTSQSGSRFLDIAYSPDSAYLAASDTRDTQIFNVTTGESLVKIASQNSDSVAVEVAFSDDSRTLFAVMNQGVLEVWNVARSRVTRREMIPNGNEQGLMGGVAWRWPWLAYFNREEGSAWIDVLDIVTGKTARLALPGERGAMAFNRRGDLLFAKTGHLFLIVNTESGELAYVDELPGVYADAFALNDDASQAAFVKDHQVLIWDLRPALSLLK